MRNKRAINFIYIRGYCRLIFLSLQHYTFIVIMEMKRLLLIIDPQIDFISGTLPVPNAEEAMKNLAEYVREHGNEYAEIVATTDWHPYNHLSFAPQGGSWPVHCVQHSVGAAIYEPLLVACNTAGKAFKVLEKGNSADREEYSIMQNPESKTLLNEIIRSNEITEIHVCGLAGNICVLNTLKDMVQTYGKDMFRVLTEYSPSLDDGSELRLYLESLH